MPEWGRTIGRKMIGGNAVQILEPRPMSALAFLVEAEKWGDREFIIYGTRRISFAQFIAATYRAAERFALLGVKRGDVVLLNGANSPEWLLAFWGLIRQGAIVAQGNAWWSGEEIVRTMDELDAAFMLADERRRASLPAKHSFSCEALEDLAGLFDGVTDVPPLHLTGNEDDPAILIFTSGTTGVPKAATLSHRAVVACLHNIYCHRGKLPNEFSADDPQMTLFCCSPLFHVGGFLLQSQALLTGHRLVLMEGRASGEAMLDIIERERVNIFLTVPTLLARVVDHPDAPNRDLKSVVSFSAAGAAVNPDMMEQARTIFPSAGVGGGSTYGMTESGGSVTMISGPDYLDHPGSAGKPLPACELKIAVPNEEGEGEILIRAPSNMSGYWGREAETIIDADGFIHTGDLGRIDEGGYLTVTGRSKDIIIRGGENVSPALIEQRLYEHPDVIEVSVVGLPHDALGEEVAAAIVLKPGAAVTEAELAAFVSGAIAYFQVPTKWWIRSEALPTNAAGKVLKTELRANWPEQTRKAS